MDNIAKKLLELVADWKGEPTKSAFNIREDTECAGRQNTENVRIETKTDRPGIDIIVKNNTKGEKIYIPALVTHSGVKDLVYNDFYIGENADVTIVAGCGVNTDGCDGAEHNGIHRFFLEKNARVVYVEKHIGMGEGTGERIINPQTYIEAAEGSYMEMETTQIKGVDSTKRFSKAVLQDRAKLVIKEKIMTHGKQYAETSFEVDLNGTDSSAHLVSRSVARDDSKQLFLSKVNGNAKCAGHGWL